MKQAASDPNQYLIAHVREALAQDPRVNTLDIQVKVDGRKVFLVGHATTSAKRDAITEVARELLPDYEIHNQTEVVKVSETRRAEKLS